MAAESVVQGGKQLMFKPIKLKLGECVFVSCAWKEMLKEHKILHLEKEPFGKSGWVLMVQCLSFPSKRCGICAFWLFLF